MEVKRLLILAWGLTLPVFGVTASPTTIGQSMRQATGTYPNIGTLPPINTAITISGTGSWGITRGGDLGTTACDVGAGPAPCFSVITDGAPGAACSSTPATGSGAGTVYLCWWGLGATTSLGLGAHTGTVTIGSTTITLTVTVVAANAYWTVEVKTGYGTNCSGTINGFASTCTIPDERPASAAFSIPSPGGSYTDPTFGHTVTRTTSSNFTTEYSTTPAITADNSHVLVGDAAGYSYLYSRTTGIADYGPFTASFSDSVTSPTDPDLVWFLDPATSRIRKLVPSTGVITTAADYSSSSGGRPAFSAIQGGGTVGITLDNWWSFYTGTSVSPGYLCAVNLAGLTTGNQESHTFCGDLSPYSLTAIDFPQISQVDATSGKRYVYTLSLPRNVMFSVGSSSLNFEVLMPIEGEPHSTVGQDSSSNQIVLYEIYDESGSRPYLVSAKLNSLSRMLEPVEAGGGLTFILPTYHGASSTGGHYAMSWVGYGLVSYFGNADYPTYIPVKAIGAITPGTPCAITSTGHGFTTGDSLLIGGALGGITNVNGIRTVTVTDANHYTLDGITCAGSYTANSGNALVNAATATDTPIRQEIDLLNFTTQKVKRVLQHRSKLYNSNNGTLIYYYQTPRASLSWDAKYTAFSSNYGIPEYESVWTAETGSATSSSLGSSRKGNATAKGPAVIR